MLRYVYVDMLIFICSDIYMARCVYYQVLIWSGVDMTRVFISCSCDYMDRYLYAQAFIWSGVCMVLYVYMVRCYMDIYLYGQVFI